MAGDRLSPIVNFFAGSRIDRAANSRADDAAMQAHLDHPNRRLVAVWRGRHLMARLGPDRMSVVMTTPDALGLDPDWMDRLPWTFLGLDEAGPLLAVDLGALDDPPIPAATGDAWSFEELRPLAPLLPEGEAALLAQARGMLHWRATHRFCGVCGRPNLPEQGGHRLVCAEGHQHFPRTDPVVIMLVTHGEHALLARGVRFPPNSRVLSALAGFLEPGESAEEAVAREVFEEVGVRVRDVRYHSSQPWPFPGSLMLGFHAEALDRALTIDPHEIVEARWVTRAEVRDHAAQGFDVPGPTAIASQLVQSWLDEG
ncbi:NAD(+) diphosphatase [Lichenicola sp.]|uniref:NAD(+) diphosphatase n=1 Tax=Lichenicola sp. TaxID=2804529 RepID=UPI003B00CB1B